MSVFYVGITDTNWFNLIKTDYESGILRKYVNFWTPGTKEFKAIEAGDLFLFKLHNRKTTGEKGEIVGGAIFSHYERVSITAAWDRYGRGNGSENIQVMQNSLNEMRKKNNLDMTNNIGCIILQDVFFLDKWIEEPADWTKSIVSGKKYDTSSNVGADLYKIVHEQIGQLHKTDDQIVEELDQEIDAIEIEGQDRRALVKVRVNQTVFRDRLLKRYNHCCLCNVENPALLVASHIKPWVDCLANEKLDADNGFLLCPNHDALFDGGFITFEETGHIVISDKLSLKDCMFTNVTQEMTLELTDRNKLYLEYHRKNVFKG